MQKVLIANRGEIALRIAKTLSNLQINYSYYPGKNTADFLDIEAIINYCQEHNIDAIHPGYGFLSENYQFAEQCAQHNITFIGPPAEVIRVMASKKLAKTEVSKLGIKCLPAFNINDTALVFPLLIKASNGGGGKAMRVVNSYKELEASLPVAEQEALRFFANSEVILERYIPNPRHIEVQIFGDNFGNVVHIFERECSIQRRYQKIIEESPAPRLSQALLEQITNMAVIIGKNIGYRNAGTVEFILDGQDIYFMEMNTRIQVEHPVTEMVTGLDLIAWQIKIAQGQALPLSQSAIKRHGHAIEARIYAEVAADNFAPATGVIKELNFPNLPQVRIECGLQVGDHIGINFDPLLAKVISYGANREEACATLGQALVHTQIIGIEHNKDYLANILKSYDFTKGYLSTQFIAKNHHHLLANTKPALWMNDNWRLYNQFSPSSLPTTIISSSSHQHAPQLKAPMPGKITKIDVEVNKMVLKNTPLLYLEAMKMEHIILAPSNGRIVKLLVHPGANVERGQIVVEMEFDEQEQRLC